MGCGAYQINIKRVKREYLVGLGGRWRTAGMLADADVCGGDGVGLEVEVS